VASAETEALVVCDAGPIIHLDELACLDLLNSYQKIWVPEAVWQEVKRHRPSALRRRRIRFTRITAAPSPTPELAAIVTMLPIHEGELAALCLLQSRPRATLLSDDRAAREAADRLGLKVKGTIGLILDAVDSGSRTRRQIVNLLRSIPRRTTLHITSGLLANLIVRAREGGSE